jgi:hypothetical protein
VTDVDVTVARNAVASARADLERVVSEITRHTERSSKSAVLSRAKGCGRDRGI